jgi:hypothetical protein
MRLAEVHERKVPYTSLKEITLIQTKRPSPTTTMMMTILPTKEDLEKNHNYHPHPHPRQGPLRQREQAQKIPKLVLCKYELRWKTVGYIYVRII